jgi:PIN domain nuclease of toxin-antitoxin system
LRLLLDTHFVLWAANSPRRIRSVERALLARPDVVIVVSAVSFWELRIKWNRLERDGEVEDGGSPSKILAFWQEMNVELRPLAFADCVAALAIAARTQDPFDEILLVQAQQFGAELLTRDAKLIGHPLVFSPDAP